MLGTGALPSSQRARTREAASSAGISVPAASPGRGIWSSSEPRLLNEVSDGMSGAGRRKCPPIRSCRARANRPELRAMSRCEAVLLRARKLTEPTVSSATSSALKNEGWWTVTRASPAPTATRSPV